VQCCPYCGYCAWDISEPTEAASEIVANEVYRVELTRESYPELTRRYLCASLILSVEGSDAEAGRAALMGAWAADDVADGQGAQDAGATERPGEGEAVEAARAAAARGSPIFTAEWATSTPPVRVRVPALMTAQSGLSPAEARSDHEFWGRLVESAIGAHLANAQAAGVCEVFYWRERNREVDYVGKAGRTVTAIEGKSGRVGEALPGMAAFARTFKPQRMLVVGGDAISVEQFLLKPVEEWVRA